MDPFVISYRLNRNPSVFGHHSNRQRPAGQLSLKPLCSQINSVDQCWKPERDSEEAWRRRQVLVLNVLFPRSPNGLFQRHLTNSTDQELIADDE